MKENQVSSDIIKDNVKAEEIKVEIKSDSPIASRAADNRLGSIEVADYLPLQQMMMIGIPTQKEQEMLKTVWDYFKDKSESNAGRLYAIKSTINRMGSNSIGQTDLDKIFQWVTLRKDIEDKEKLLNEL